MRDLLLDTGALVSLLDRSQKHHRACIECFEAWTGNVVSTEAVLTEASHLLQRVHGGVAACVGFFARGGATLVPTSGPALERCQALLERHADLPMDYADATLVVLAEDIGSRLIFTTDRRDFSVYRTRTGDAFELVP